ncbi:MAG TPA: glycoside hydrolase family 15 protein [Burkholderiales bacterium]|nr:glycoside hydrolase family 15 protein [Burkholderiales bacterium]
MAQSLDLALVGNCSVAALVDANAEIVWACMPRMDGDAVFCSLLRERRGDGDFGFFAVDLADFSHSEQEYIANTPIVATRLYDRRGGAVEVVDVAPRFLQFGRMFSPMTLVRQIRCIAGSPRVTLRLRPARDYGAARADTTFGAHHVRYLCGDFVLRATTDCSITALVEENPFVLQGTVSFVLGPDETLQGSPGEVARRFLEETRDYWQDWTRDLSIPFEWQDAVIRAAITLKLSAVDDTGAVVAAVTTSIPEAPGSGRNWDYRYCWLRDAYFTINALNRLDATRTLERYLSYIVNVAAGSPDARLQPVYRISGRREMDETVAPALPGYRGMGPVRIGNQAWRQVQNDVYGSAVLAATHIFFDRRLLRPGNEALFAQLEALGEQAAAVWREPDAGPWELRGRTRVHTFSSVMCWGACDRLAKIAARLGLGERAAYWRARAEAIRSAVCELAWNEKRGSFVATLGGEDLDASLLLLAELGFLRADDPRFAATVAAIERELRRGDFVFRYTDADDFGVPQNAFVVCTFWYIDALAALGRREEARALFENLLACRNRHGLLSEHIDPATRELWGNFPQTYSMVGLINSATRLSIPWEEAF